MVNQRLCVLVAKRCAQKQYVEIISIFSVDIITRLYFGKLVYNIKNLLFKHSTGIIFKQIKRT